MSTYTFENPTNGYSLEFNMILADVGCIQCVSDATYDDSGTLDVMISITDGDQLDVEVINIGLSNPRLICTTIDFNPPQTVYETNTSRVSMLSDWISEHWYCVTMQLGATA